MTKRLLCIHGHYYQPPRENPWIEDVEVQDSAAPFHDWNARITAECYGPNGGARMKLDSGRICDIVNNYRHISFNFGPTLLAWLERHAPNVYRSILEADARSVEARGHGNAIAQGYNHAILPLCNERDRRTQIRWGIEDFRRRFGRDPEGFWLPETAADKATLRALAEEGIRFTVLSPFQAAKVRAPGGEWQDARNAQFDPTRPYKVDVGGGRTLAVFFYDGPIARAIAFGEGLSHGDDLVRRLEAGFSTARGHDEILSVAVDGETFGHHKKGGEEVLGSALRQLSRRDDIELVNYGQVLDRMPPEWEAEVAEGSSWSCAHGVERWKSDCGCQANGQAGWKQTWRAPLRNALDLLRDRLAVLFERELGQIVKDPWAARDEFIELVLDPERREARSFLSRHAGRVLSESEHVRALKLLEMQRQAMLMYTSCGWFFSEISGLETVQILKYAARALQLAREVTGEDLEGMFVEALRKAPSNISKLGNGAKVFEAYVKPSVVSQEGVAAHYAISNMVSDYGKAGKLFCYRFSINSRRRDYFGTATLEVGRLELLSFITHESLEASYCVVHLGASDFRCGLKVMGDGREHDELEKRLFAHLGHQSLAALLREVDRSFPGRDYTLRDLFLDERRHLAGILLQETMKRYEGDYLQIFESNLRLMEFLREIDSPVPRALRAAADFALGTRVQGVVQGLADGKLDLAETRNEIDTTASLAEKLGAKLDLTATRDLLHDLVALKIERLCTRPTPEKAQELADVIELGQRLDLSLDLWHAQNVIWAFTGEGRLPLDRASIATLANRLWFDEGTLLHRVERAAAQAAEAAEAEETASDPDSSDVALQQAPA